MSEYPISAGELESLTAKLDRFSEALTDRERGALLHVFDLAVGSEGDVDGFAMGLLDGGSVFGPPMRNLFTIDSFVAKGKKEKKTPEIRPESKPEEAPK